MMYPERMERVTIVAPAAHLKETIEILHKHKVLHIIDYTKERLDIGSPLPGSEQLADLLVKTRSIIHSLGIATNQQAPLPLSGDLMEQLTRVNEEATALFQEQKRTEEELKQSTAEQQAYGEIEWLHVNPVKLRDSQHLTYFFGTIKESQSIQQELATITKRHYLELQKNGPGILVLIENEKATACKDLLQTRGFVAADHTRITNLTKPAAEHITELETTITALQRQLGQNKIKQAAFAKQHGPFLVTTETLLAGETRKAQTPLRFAVTKHSFFINGWVPQQNIIILQNNLNQALKNEVLVQIVHTQEEGPTKLDNSLVVSPFEFIIKLYTLPRYHEIDPSTILFLSFPLFFGFMLGDIGYGITLLIVAMLLRWLAKSDFVKSLASILIMSSVATTIFGIVFGEFFGAEQLGNYHLPYLIHRAENMTVLLGVAVAIGVIHITLGLVIGFLNERHHHGTWKAFCAKISWIILLAGSGLLAAGYAFQLPTVLAGWLLIAASIILIYLGEGMKGLVEIPGIFSNIMSYARLMALGVASAALAVVINEIAGQLFKSGVFGIIAAILILLFGHAINFILGIIGPFLHSLRLHYVEFFTKFYEGGGKPYKPFGAEDR